MSGYGTATDCQGSYTDCHGLLIIIFMVSSSSGLPNRSTFGRATRCLGLLIVCGYCFGLIVPWFGLFFTVVSLRLLMSSSKISFLYIFVLFVV